MFTHLAGAVSARRGTRAARPSGATPRGPPSKTDPEVRGTRWEVSLLAASNDQRIDVEETQHYLLIVWGRGRSSGRLPGSSPTRCYARPKPGSVVRLLSWALRSGSARSARTRDGAERDVDDPALLGNVGTALVALEDLREGRTQGA